MLKKTCLMAWILLLCALAVLPAAPVFAQSSANTWIAFIGNDGNVFLIRPDGSLQTPLTSDANPMANVHPPPDFVEYARPIWSPDGQKLSFIRRTGHYDTAENRLIVVETVMIYDLNTRNTQPVAEDLGPYAWSPDGKALVYGGRNQWGMNGWREPVNGIWQLDLSSRQQSELVKPQGNNPLTTPHFSPDGRYLGFFIPPYMEGLGFFGYYDLQEDSYHSWETSGQEVGQYSWANDSSFIIFDKNTYIPTPGNQLWRANALFENPQVISPDVPNYAFYNPLVSPDNRFVAAIGAVLEVAEEKFALWVMNSDGSEPREVFVTTAPQNLYTFAWSPDSRSLVIASGDYDQQIVQVLDAGNGSAVQIADGREPAWQPVFAPEQPATQITITPASSAPTVVLELPTAGPSETPMPVPTMVDRVLPGLPSGMGVTATLILGGVCLGGLVVLALVIVFVVLPGRKKS